MSATLQEQRMRFRDLHEQGCFVLPNPWDIGSARMMQYMGFPAIATTSSGYAWSTGRPDYSVGFEDVIDHLQTMCGAIGIPVSADFESGFASEHELLSANVAEAVRTGIAGLSIEDRRLDDPARLYATSDAVERVRVARQSIAQTSRNVMLVAGTEMLLRNPDDARSATDRLVAFADAGADCLFAPGVVRVSDIRSMVRAIAPKPLGVVIVNTSMKLDMFADLGVRRVSVGRGLAQAAWGATVRAAECMRKGRFDDLDNGERSARLNYIFSSFL
jgi:2-methylisocitrate lyase-like PEP mutase family enzyme